MRDVFVIGVGMTQFGKFPERSLSDLGKEACWLAMKDAGVRPDRIQAAYCGNALGSYLQRENGIGQSVLWQVGIRGIPVMNIENACASGSSAFREAWMGVAAGLYDVAIAVGVEKTVMKKGALLDVGDAELEAKIGDVFPGLFAMRAQRHMYEYGTTLEQMAKVSVKNHHNGCLNPYAQYQKELTVEEVLHSPMIADPLTLLSCCPNSDGAAAAIVASREVVKMLSAKPVKVLASILGTGLYHNKKDMALFDLDFKVSKEAYEMAGVGPEDIDLTEVHDAFTIAEIMHYEGLGFCRVGEGGRLIDEGETEIKGRIPVNPSGGLLAKGHPVGASGIAQIAEIVWHLRGEAGARQVANARIGLSHMMGGGKEGDVGACTVHILERINEI
ncbi:MAG: thiolase family protein [Thermodesulfobacteriota bacterium]